LNVNQSVPEVSNDHIRRVNSIDEARRGGGGRVHVGSVDRVDFRGDDSHERVDESNGDLKRGRDEENQLSTTGWKGRLEA